MINGHQQRIKKWFAGWRCKVFEALKIGHSPFIDQGTLLMKIRESRYG